MADYYTHLSILVTGSEEELDHLIRMLNDANDELDQEEEGSSMGVLYEKEKRGVWIHDDAGYVEIEPLCEAISSWLSHFNSPKYVTVEWAHTCSRPILDAYGGGAALIRAERVDYLSTAQWLRQQEAPVV